MVYASFVGFDLPSLVLVAAILIVILVVSSMDQTPANLPPFPGRAFPIVGHLPYLGAEVREKLLEISKATGGIFSMYLGRRLVIVLSSYDVLKEALVKQADVFSDRPHGGPLPVLGIRDGILAPSGARWQENRHTILRILKDFGLGSDVMPQKVMQEVCNYMDTLFDLAGKATDVKDITTCATANIICSVVIGKRFQYNDKVFIDLLHDFDEFVSLVGENNLHQWFPQLKYIPGDYFKTKSLIKIDEEIMSKMNSFIEKIKEEKDELNSRNLISSYIDELMEKQKAGHPTELSMKQLNRVLFDLVIAGSETTSVTLLWFYLYMIHYPDIQEKFYQEIAAVIGTNRAPTYQDRKNLNYVSAVILETQRLASILPYGILHGCTKETSLHGYTIPKDATIFVHLDSVLLDDEIWGDAQTFRPERFLQKGKLVCPEHFIAFGLGKRACLGEFLARMELFLFTVSVVQRFHIVPADPECLPPRTYLQGIECLPTPYKVKFIDRDMY